MPPISAVSVFASGVFRLKFFSIYSFGQILCYFPVFYVLVLFAVLLNAAINQSRMTGCQLFCFCGADSCTESGKSRIHCDGCLFWCHQSSKGLGKIFPTMGNAKAFKVHLDALCCFNRRVAH